MGTNSDRQIDPARFRRVLGQLPTGVTVVTAHHSSGPVAMSANSVTSVSLEPPLILFCPGQELDELAPDPRERPFLRQRLRRPPRGGSRRFAARGVDRFAGIPWHSRPSGPALDEAVAWIECTIDAEHPAGDHLIVVGAVDEVDIRDGEADPLVFFRGRYGSFLPEG